MIIIKKSRQQGPGQVSLHMGIWTSSWHPCPRLPRSRLSVMLRSSQTKNEKKRKKREENSPHSSMKKKKKTRRPETQAGLLETRPSRRLSGRAWVRGGGCCREAELLLPLSTSPAVPADVFQYRLLCGGTTIGSRSQLCLSCTSQEFGSSGDKALHILL